MTAAAVRVVFAGTPQFAVPSLLALREWGAQLEAVYTQPDRPAGRGRKTSESPVKRAALAHGLALEQPPSLRTAAALRRLEALAPELIVVAAYGLILPPAVLALPRHGCINVHASLLPRWRGAAPIQRALLAGDAETGVSIMRMDAGLDTGDVLCMRACAIDDRDTAASLHARLAKLGAELLVACLDGWLQGTVQPRAQDSALATYAPKIERTEAELDLRLPAPLLARMVRAFDPWPVARVRWGDEWLRIFAAHAVPAAEAAPGHVLEAGARGIDVGTGEGLLRITRLQQPGRRVVSAGDFCNAHDLRGACFALPGNGVD